MGVLFLFKNVLITSYFLCFTPSFISVPFPLTFKERESICSGRHTDFRELARALPVLDHNVAPYIAHQSQYV